MIEKGENMQKFISHEILLQYKNFKLLYEPVEREKKKNVHT